MTFLKKLAGVLLKAGEVAAGIGPWLPPGYQPVAQTVTTDLHQIQNVIVQAEVMGQALQLPGPDKLKAAAPSVAQIILQSSVLAGRKIANPELFQRGSTKVADGMADILNSLDEGSVKTDSKT